MIKKYLQFINEISGTELVGPVGPAYGETRLQNKTINVNDTDVIYSDIGGRIYTMDEYNQLYQDYLKMGGPPLIDYNKENLEKVLFFMQEEG
jgi:hypothetical protein